MDDKRSIALVFGYLQDIDYPNEVARGLGLNKRFAIALDTYRPEKNYMYFDAELLYLVLTCVLKEYNFSSIELQFDEDKPKSVASLNELREVLIEESDEEEREPFLHMKLISDDETCCYVQTEFYTLVGGPSPYHDTYTFSFYVNQYERPAIQNKVYQLCIDNNIVVSEIRSGCDVPIISLWTKLKGILT